MDASWTAQDKTEGSGFTIKNHLNLFICAGYEQVRADDAEEAEALSALRGLEAARHLGLQRILLLSDCQRIVRAFRERSEDLSWGALTIAPDLRAAAEVLEQHLACAAFELPLSLFYDEKYFGPGLNSAIPALKNKGLLSSYLSRDSLAKIWSYIGHEKKPSHAVSIQAIEAEKYKVVDKTSNEVLEEIEESKAFFEVYEGAVYMHQGKTYLVNALDLLGKVALCQEANLKYYTDA
ncbi:hypothetical protein GIB67_022761 [Kingdonia uniflora]|uniref:RNase H type-1 domain-containing protein n=1 Tax=Kingdonia uniflora TaxID=39325 RepID=A0A7J7LK18_9MAGN|nr:hypothetical protein GIB67_022761 [Kingdonia uniflora]